MNDMGKYFSTPSLVLRFHSFICLFARIRLLFHISQGLVFYDNWKISENRGLCGYYSIIFSVVQFYSYEAFSDYFLLWITDSLLSSQARVCSKYGITPICPINGHDSKDHLGEIMTGIRSGFAILGRVELLGRVARRSMSEPHDIWNIIRKFMRYLWRWNYIVGKIILYCIVFARRAELFKRKIRRPNIWLLKLKISSRFTYSLRIYFYSYSYGINNK